MTEREKFEAWASSQGWLTSKTPSGEYAGTRCHYTWQAWQAAKHQANCEVLADLHKLERKVAHGCTDASCKECDK